MIPSDVEDQSKGDFCCHLGECFRSLLLLGIILILSAVSFAQVDSASVSGVVYDQSGAIIVGAEVTVTNSDTNISSVGVSNQSGVYLVTSLKPGRYRIRVAKDGFKGIDLTDLILNVQDSVSRNFTLQLGSVSETVSVEGNGLQINTLDAAVSTVIGREFVESLPLNGRSFNALLQLTPGVVIAANLGGNAPGQFSIGGQRTDANSFTVDGVSANFGVSPAAPGVGIGQSGTGSAQAFSSQGGTSSLVSVDALQEFRIETSSFAPEFGRSPGGQVILTTRSGTNQFHGSAFDYFRNTVMDANDWFANSNGAPRTPEHHNDFGGVFSGPIRKERAFFFFSYEGARLRVPTESPLNVPSNFARNQAQANAPALLPFLNAYPQVPSQAIISPDGYRASFTSLASSSASLDATSLRIDHTFNRRVVLFGRYNYAPSSSTSPFGSELTLTKINTQTLTIGLNMAISPRFGNTVRANYSTQNSFNTSTLDTFGGAVPFSPSLLLGSLSVANNLGTFETIDGTSPLAFGRAEDNGTKQVNVVDDFSISLGDHQLKVGGDFRTIFLRVNPSQYSLLFQPVSLGDFLTSGTAMQSAAKYLATRVLSKAFSVYAQDTWRMSPRLNLTYGLRWELNPAPSGWGSTQLASWTNVGDPSNIALAQSGTPVWRTTFGNFAPRIGVAYQLTQKGDFVLRAGGGIFYDLGVGSAAQLSTQFPNYAVSPFPHPFVSLPVTDVAPLLPIISLAPPYPPLVYGFSPDLALPRSYQWNVAIEKSFGTRSAFSATYVGQLGRDLLRSGGLSQPNSNFSGDFFLTRNDANSNYNALQVQYHGRPATWLQTVLNFTWSHSLDNASDDVTAGLSNTIISAASDYSSSSYDARRVFSGAVILAIPAAVKTGLLNIVTRDWSTDTVIVARSGFPFNAQNLLVSLDAAGFVVLRPDVVRGQPYWIMDPAVPGGQRLNPDKFVIPSTIRQGTEARNDIPGFGLVQVDLSLARKFPINERLNLQFRADAFNLFNHPNFANPISPYIGFGPSFLQSSTMLNQGLGGLNPLFQQGGPRSLQLSLKLNF